MNYVLPLSLAAALITVPATAQTISSTVPDRSGTGYFGPSVIYSSEYLGSADEDVQVLPYLSLENVKGFDLFGTTLGYRLIDTKQGQGLRSWSLRAGPSISYQGGRDSDDSPTLMGFEDVDLSIPLGGYIRSNIGPIGLRVDAGQDIAGGHDGLTVDASIGTFLPLGNVFVRPTLTAHWADNSHNDSFFGVSAGQAAASGLNAYEAGAGIHSYSAGLLSWIEFNERYALTFIGSYRWFTDEATNSPILTAADGSDEGIFAAISLSRRFDTNKW